MKTHKNLKVWKRSINYVVKIYSMLKILPKDEKYILVDQMKRSVISIPSNISEGASRNSKKEYIRFLYIASGSAAELETQLIIVNKLEYYKTEELIEELEEIRKMIFGLINYNKSKIK